MTEDDGEYTPGPVDKVNIALFYIMALSGVIAWGAIFAHAFGIIEIFC